MFSDHRTSLSSLLFLTLSPQLAFSWGQFPHRTIALLSTRFLLPETAKFISTVLPKSENVASAALWPDYYAHTPQGRWSGPLHYIDGHWDEEGSAQDCALDYNRDCGGKQHCVVWGVVNSTQQLLLPYVPPSDLEIEEYEKSQPMTTLPFTETDVFTEAKKDAHTDAHIDDDDDEHSPHWLTPHHLYLRFILHFIGDLHQPLHTIGYKRGGNGIPILFHGKSSNLHSAWDTLIPVYGYLGNKVGTVSPRDSVTWANSLFHKIEGLRKTLDKEEWESRFIGQCFQGLGGGKSGHQNRQEILKEEKIQDCMLEWAGEANKFVCSYVFNGTGGPDAFVDRELAGENGEFYAEEGYKIVEELVMLAGWRLAGWLNLVVTGTTGLGEHAGGHGNVNEQVVLDIQPEL